MTTSSPQSFRSRRSLLATITATGATLAGCTGLVDDTDDTPSFEDHVASREIDIAPRLGPPPADAEAVIVEFGDPSCSQCATFGAETFPELRVNLIDPGRVAYYWRAHPIVEPWGPTATRALFAVQDREPDAFWWLKKQYYEGRSEISDDVVLDFTTGVLGERDSVDAEAVLEDIRAGAGVDRLESDGDVADASEITSVPSFVLFRDETYVTTVVGPQNTAVFEGALDLE